MSQFNLAHLQQLRGMEAAAPRTRPDGVETDPGLAHGGTDAAGLIAATPIKIALRAAITQNEPVRIAPARRKRVAHQANRTGLLEGGPVIRQNGCRQQEQQTSQKTQNHAGHFRSGFVRT